MWPRLAFALIVTTALLAAPTRAAQSPALSSPFAAAFAEEPSPAPARSAQPNLTVDRLGRTWG